MKKRGPDISLLNSKDIRRIGDFVHRCKAQSLPKGDLHKSIGNSMVAKGYILDFGDRWVIKTPWFDAYKNHFGIKFSEAKQ